MTGLAVFSFENTSIRTLGTSDNPLFVAADICKALNHSNASKAIANLVDADNLVKAEIDTKGGKQTVNCVNESGLYELAFGSRVECAKRFRKWVVREVLPAIRKSGKYECPANPRYLTDQQCWAIQSAVGKRAKGVGAHFQTIYRALKAHFQVPTYTRILEKDFNAALEFIATCELKAPVKKEPKPVPMPPQEPQRHEVPCPCCGRYPVPEGCIVLSREDAERIRTFIYQWKYVFRRPLDVAYEFLCAVDSPMRGRFWEAVHDLNLSLLEATLERQGLPALRN